MKLLLDTHALLWWLGDDSQLTDAARDVIADPENDVLVSVASAWECAIKLKAGKLPEAAPLIAAFRPALALASFSLLDMTLEHALAAGALPRHHGDPFDRMLIAQGLLEGAPLVSIEKRFDDYGVRRIW